MIVATAPAISYEVRYRPSHLEIADTKISEHYRSVEQQLNGSREGSEFIRKTIAELAAQDKLSRLSKLSNNWDGFGNDRPSAESIRQASSFAKLLIDAGLMPDGILPSAEGGVAICFVRDGKYADVEFLNSGDTLAVRYEGNQRPVVWVVGQTQHAADATIQSLSNFLST